MRKILVAAKSDPVRRALCGMLRAAGYQIIESVDGLDAHFALGRERLDLLLTDLHLPGMDGLALTLAAKRNHPRLKVLIMSEDASVAATLKSLDVHPDGIIFKPFNSQAMLGEIARLLPGRIRAA